jgi:hypothetical protein
VDEEGLVQISNLNIVLVSIVLRVTDLTAWTQIPVLLLGNLKYRLRYA